MQMKYSRLESWTIRAGTMKGFIVTNKARVLGIVGVCASGQTHK